MSDDEAWFLEQGFLVEVEEQSPGLFWAHLVNANNPKGRADKYGRGDAAESSISRARQRYEVEQIG